MLKNEYDNIYSIKILKYIYNIFGYDLNKIPFCYISYLQHILEKNIETYIGEKYIITNFLFEKFQIYKDSINDVSQEEEEEEAYEKHINSFDKGFLYYLKLYMNEYLTPNKPA